MIADEGLSINARFLHSQVTGVQRYAREMLRQLTGSLRFSMLRPSERWARGFKGHLWEQLVMPGLVGKGQWLWSPCNSGPLAVRRQVVTIHDAATLDHPEWFSRRFASWYQWMIPRIARAAAHVITVSQFSKERLVARTGVSADKITVVWNGVSADFQPSAPSEVARVNDKYGLDKPFVICVGSLDPRKNLPRVLRAWARVGARIPQASLAVCGVGSSNFADAQLPRDAAERVHFLGFVPDEDLAPLYTGCRGLVYPSLYEGFGLPALEALACGASVVTSLDSPMAEFCGEDAVLVDPRDEVSIGEAIVRVCQVDEGSPLERSKRARSISWEACARRTLEVLRNVSA